MLLVLDVGNTNIVMGVYDGEILVDSWRLGTDSTKTADEIGSSMRSLLNLENSLSKGLEACIISSVVPRLDASLFAAVKRYIGVPCMFVNFRMNMNIHLPGMETGLPAEIGADRITNAAAAFHLYGGRPIIIIDYGTATKYDVLDASGLFVTGITAPGVGISADAIFKRAALLHHVEMKAPPSIVARNTTESLQAGIVLGTVGETEYIVNRLKKELSLSDCFVVATGGFSGIIAEHTALIDCTSPHLTLLGLRVLHSLNL